MNNPRLDQCSRQEFSIGSATSTQCFFKTYSTRAPNDNIIIEDNWNSSPAGELDLLFLLQERYSFVCLIVGITIKDITLNEPTFAFFRSNQTPKQADVKHPFLRSSFLSIFLFSLTESATTRPKEKRRTVLVVDSLFLA